MRGSFISSQEMRLDICNQNNVRPVLSQFRWKSQRCAVVGNASCRIHKSRMFLCLSDTLGVCQLQGGNGLVGIINKPLITTSHFLMLSY
jgi:hypothetical protein